MNNQEKINLDNGFNSKDIFRNIKFEWIFLKSSAIFWISFSLFFLSSILMNLVFLIMGNNLILEYSFLSIIINLSLMFVFDFIMIIKLFLEAKYSSVDLILVSKPFSRSIIYLSRYILIFALIFLNCFAQFFINLIILLSFQQQINWLAFQFVAYVLITPFISLFTTSLLILFVIKFKKIWSIIVSFVVLFLFSFLAIFVRAISPSSQPIKYSQVSRNSFSKISCVNENNKVETFIVDKVNSTITNSDDENIINLLDGDKFYNYLVPGEWLISLYSSIGQNVLSGFDDVDNHKFSLIKTKYKNINVPIFSSNQIVIALRPDDINPFELSNIDYEDLIIKQLKEIEVTDGCLNLKNSALVNTLFNKINNELNWSNINFNSNELKTIKSLLGIDQSFSTLFYYWEYYSFLSNKTPDLKTKIELNFNVDLWNLLSYLWTSEDVRNNLLVLNYFGKLSDIYPSIMSFNENQKPLEMDIDFIQNNLIKFNQGDVFYLDSNKIYQQTSIDKLKELSSSIIDQSSWNDYVALNTLTLESSENLINNLFSLIPNIYNFSFNENYFNPYQYSLYLIPYNSTLFNYNSLIISIVIVVTIGINVLSFISFRKINYKNMEV